MESATSSPASGHFLTVSDAARLLGVHANTVRSWTAQGVLGCLRINERGDRRYRRQEIARFLAQTGRAGPASANGGVAADAGPPAASGLLARTARLAARPGGVTTMVRGVAELLCREQGYAAAALVKPDGTAEPLVGSMRPDARLCQRAAERHRVLTTTPRRRDGAYQAALPFGAGSADGVVLLSGTTATRTAAEHALLSAIAAQLGMARAFSGQIEQISRRERLAQMLIAAEDDMSARLDPDRVLGQMVDGAMETFGAQRAGVFLGGVGEAFEVRVTRALSAEFCQILEHATNRPLTALALSERRAVAAMDYADDPRAIDLRRAVRREGFNTVAVAPLISDGRSFGVLCLFHDERHEWTQADLTLLDRLARHGASVLGIAQDYSQMATWAAQLQSIQQLGARLTRLRSVAQIGQAICAELGQLIDTHNTRVYRVSGEDCVPVAWRGQAGEYEAEDGDQLRLKVGEGITGWVARSGLAQNIGNAAGDKRAKTIPGTAAGLDESLLLAPMLFDDEVIGVIVLAKLGLRQFTADDLRLLEIYASIAAQAMANADVTERLHAQTDALARQVSSQRELLRVTESILGTLDTQTLLQEIAERLTTLVAADNISVSLHEPALHRLRTIYARGVHAEDSLELCLNDDEDVSGAVVASGEAELIPDKLADPRVLQRSAAGAQAGALIVAPLRGQERVQGVLVIERLGVDAAFSAHEFELVKLFAAHVSIALRNAAAHRAVAIQAETDRLTGLLNHGAMTEQLARLVDHGARFGMLMVDLDRFKDYNDRYGHQAGNVMLQRVAAQLRASCRDSDLVFRFGGDEFAILLPATGSVGAHTVAAKVHRAVADIEKASPWVTVSCSVGVAAYPRDGRDVTALILAADRACYAAKRAGRNQIVSAQEGMAMAAEFQPTEPTAAEAEAVY